MATAGRNAKGQITIDGTPTFIRLLYDSGFAGASGTDMQGHVAARNLARFKDKLNVYLHIMSASQDNGLRLCDVLDPLNMYVIAVGNGFGGAGVEQMSSGQGGFDVTVDRNGFRAKFKAKKRALGVYLSDEPNNEDPLRADLVKWHAAYKAAMPNLATMVVFLQHAIHQVRAWAPAPIADWLCCDPYPIGAGAETAPGGNPTDTYGYANFEVGQACADIRHYALKHGKSPIAILGLLKQGGPATRYPWNDELWSHMVAAVAEGVVGIGWWAFGVQNGALHNPGDVTPAERDRMTAYLDVMTTFLAALEPVLLSDPSPALLTGNSTATGNPIAWRKALVDTYRTGGQDVPAWLYGLKLAYDEESAKLSQTPPDVSMSEQMLDQSGHVRTRCWEAGKVGYVFAYNVHPMPQPVTFTCRVPVSKVEVIDENRVVAIAADGRSWTDTCGGGSSLKQGVYRQGHVYKLTLAEGSAPPDPTPVTPATPKTLRIDYTVQDASGKTLGKATQDISLSS